MTAPDVHAEDLALVQAVLAGEPEPTSRLVERLSFVPCALRSLNRRLGRALGKEDLDDLTQDTLALLWPRLATYNGQAALESWIYGFCLNGLMNALRKQRRRKSADTPSEELADELGMEDRPLEDGFERVRLREALGRLPPVEARVVRLRYYEELTFDQIGQQLVLSPNTAKAAFYRGMKRLEEFLRPEARKAKR
jgi:RNA polymerase sigma-70 factor (ECF subfamily)